jgi:hypothetical protein
MHLPMRDQFFSITDAKVLDTDRKEGDVTVITQLSAMGRTSLTHVGNF